MPIDKEFKLYRESLQGIVICLLLYFLSETWTIIFQEEKTLLFFSEAVTAVVFQKQGQQPIPPGGQWSISC